MWRTRTVTEYWFIWKEGDYCADTVWGAAEVLKDV